MAYVNKGYQHHQHQQYTRPAVGRPVGVQQQQPRVSSYPTYFHRHNYHQHQPQLQQQPLQCYYNNARRFAPPAAAAEAPPSRTATTASSHSASLPPRSTSRSLGGSKASVVSRRSGNSSIQQEYRDRRVRRGLLAPYLGQGRWPFLCACALALLGALLVVAAGVVFGLRFHNNIMLSIDKGEIVGPVLIVIGLACFAGAIKLYYDAHSVSNRERKRLQFVATSDNMVHISTINVNQKRLPGEPIVSGTASTGAVTRAPSLRQPRQAAARTTQV